MGLPVLRVFFGPSLTGLPTCFPAAFARAIPAAIRSLLSIGSGRPGPSPYDFRFLFLTATAMTTSTESLRQTDSILYGVVVVVIADCIPEASARATAAGTVLGQ